MAALATDYLVIGSGAVGLAFVDTMLDESDATFTIVDRHHLPGGHWNDAYPFVRLHQPSAFYGVSSMRLGTDRIDEVGSNAGFYELATGSEVCAYFERVVRDRLLPSGRVRYLPMSDWSEAGTITSLLSGEVTEVEVGRRIVDGTFFSTSVPSTHARGFAVEQGVVCVAPNELPRRCVEHDRFTVLGGGKTAMDAVVWLLDHGAPPGAIRWVCPRGSWLIDRRTTQPGRTFLAGTVGGAASQYEAAAEATSITDLFHRLEAAGQMVRVDTSSEPEMFHYATTSSGEVEQLRRVDDVVRGERVATGAADRLTMTSGAELPAAPGTLYVDCTASAVDFTSKRTVPVFGPGRITIQPVFAPLASYSAAIVAHVEASYDDDAERNALCTPVPLADTPAEWPASTLGNLANQQAWAQDRAMQSWTRSCRLNPSSAAMNDPTPFTDDEQAILMRVLGAIGPAAENLRRLADLAA